jgi:hypothetical protein
MAIRPRQIRLEVARTRLEPEMDHEIYLYVSAERLFSCTGIWHTETSCLISPRWNPLVGFDILRVRRELAECQDSSLDRTTRSIKIGFAIFIRRIASKFGNVLQTLIRHLLGCFRRHSPFLWWEHEVSFSGSSMNYEREGIPGWCSYSHWQNRLSVWRECDSNFLLTRSIGTTLCNSI